MASPSTANLDFRLAKSTRFERVTLQVQEPTSDSAIPDPAFLPSDDSEIDQIWSAVIPTAFAGGVFPIVCASLSFMLLGLWAFVYGQESPIPGKVFGFVFGGLLLAVIGFVIGYVYALVASLLAAALVQTFHWTTSERFHPRLLIQVVGGMTGYGCLAIFPVGYGDDAMFPAWVAAATLAMVMGMYACAYYYRLQYSNYERRAHELQFGVRGIFVAVTWVAVLLAIFRWLPSYMLLMFGIWIVLQSSALAIGEGIRRLRIRKGWYREEKSQPVT